PVGSGGKAVVGQSGVGDQRHPALGHMAGGAIIGTGRALGLRRTTASPRVTGEAFRPIVSSRLTARGREMGIVARETAQFLAARAEAAAGAHGDVVLEKIGAIRVTGR